MLKIWFYLISIIKYFIFLSILTGIISYIFPFIAPFVFIIGILALHMMAKGNAEEKYLAYLKKKEERRLVSLVANSKDEFAGFDDALTLTRRNMM